MDTKNAAVGTVVTVAGRESSGYADGAGSNAAFNGPGLIAVDSKGYVYVPEWTNHRIRKVSPSGVVTSWIGGNKGYGDGNGTNASLYSPYGCVMDTSGFLYISDAYNRRVRKVTPTGDVSTLVGSGVDSFVPGRGSSASIRYPTGLAVDSAQNVYVCDSWARRICKVSASGEMKPLAGSGVQGTADGMGTSAQFDYPTGICVDLQSNLFVCDYNQCVIRKVSANGLVSTFVGSRRKATTDGQGTYASFNGPNGIAIDADNNLYVTELDGCRVRKVTPDGVVTTFSGNLSKTSVDGVGTNASWSGPFGITVNDENTVFVADGQRIRRIKGEFMERSSDRLFHDLVESNTESFIKIARQCGYVPPSQAVKTFTVRSDIDSDVKGTDSLKHLKKDIASLSYGFYPAESSVLRAQVSVLRKIHRLLDVDTDRERQRTAKAAKEYIDSQVVAGGAVITQSSAALRSLMALFCNSLLATAPKSKPTTASLATHTQVLTVLRTLVAQLPPEPAVIPSNSIDLYRSFFPIVRAAVLGTLSTADSADAQQQQAQSVNWYFRLALAVGSLEQLLDLAHLLLTVASAGGKAGGGEQDFSVLMKPLVEYRSVGTFVENELKAPPSAAISKPAAGVLVLRHLARIAAPFSIPTDNKLLFSEPLAIELTATTFSTLLELLKHGAGLLSNSNAATQTQGVTVINSTLSVLQVQLLHYKRARDVDVIAADLMSTDVRAQLWQLLFTSLPASLNQSPNVRGAKAQPIITRLGTMMEQSFTVLAPTVSQLTSLSEYLNRATVAPSADSKSGSGGQPVAPEFAAPYFKLLVARFATFQAGVSLVQDLHSETDEKAYTKKLSELNAVLHPLMAQLADKSLSESSLKLCVHFQTALFHYLERHFVTKIEAAASAAAAAVSSAVATSNANAATATSTLNGEVKSMLERKTSGLMGMTSSTATVASTSSESKSVSASTSTVTSQMAAALAAAIAPPPGPNQLFKISYIQALSTTVTSYSQAVIEACTKLFKSMSARAYPTLLALETELSGAAQLYRPLLASLAFVLPHLPSDMAITILVPLLHFAAAARSVEQNTGDLKGGGTTGVVGPAGYNTTSGGGNNNTTGLTLTIPGLMRQTSADRRAGLDDNSMRPALISTTAMSLCAQCCGRLLKSDARVPAETDFKSWLDSPLLSGGLLYGQTAVAPPKSLLTLLNWLREQKIQLPEDLPVDPSLDREAKFIRSVIDNTPNSPGAALIKKLKSYVKDSRMLPPTTVAAADQACRTLFACSLHHNHRVQLAMMDAESGMEPDGVTPTPPHTVVTRLWAKSISIRGVVAMWKSQGGESAMKSMLAAFTSRAMLLLKLHPAALAEVPSASLRDIKSNLDSTPKMRKIPSIGRVPSIPGGAIPVAAAGAAAGPDGIDKVLRSKRWLKVRTVARVIRFTFQAIWRLKRMIHVSLGASTGGSAHKDIHALVTDFVQDSALDTDALWSIMIAERGRAMSRLAVFIFLQRLVSHANATELTVVLKEAVAGVNPGVHAVSHYLDRLGAVGPDYKLLLSQSYFLFLSYLAHLESQSSTALMCILDLANLEYDAYDLRQLQNLNIPRFVYALSSFVGSNKLILQNPSAVSELARYGKMRLDAPWNVRFACFQLFRLMCAQAMHHQKTNTSDSDPTIHQLRATVLACLFTQLQTIWAQRPEAPRLNKPSDAPVVWTCEDCSFTNEVGTPHCSVCRSPFGDVQLHFLESKQPTPVNWSQRELKVHYGDLGLAWYRADLVDTTAQGKPIRRLEPPSLFEFNVFANQLLWIVLHCVEHPSGRSLVAENRGWVRFLLSLASIKSLPPASASDAASIAERQAKASGAIAAPTLSIQTSGTVKPDLNTLVQSPTAAAAAAAVGSPPAAFALPPRKNNGYDAKYGDSKSGVAIAMTALPALSQYGTNASPAMAVAVAKPAGPMMAIAVPVPTVYKNNQAVNADTTPSSLQSAILATRILRYVVPAVSHVVDLIHDSGDAAAASVKSPRNVMQAEFLLQILRGIAPGVMAPVPNITPDVSTRQGELVCLYRSLLGSVSSRQHAQLMKEQRREKHQSDLVDDADEGTSAGDSKTDGAGGDSKSGAGAGKDGANSAGWERAARELLLNSLNQLRQIVPALIAAADENKFGTADGCKLIEEQYAEVCGALYVLGAHLEVVREGGQVRGTVNGRQVQGILTNLTPAPKATEKDTVMVRVEERTDVKLDDTATLFALDDVPIPFDHLSDDDMSVMFDIIGTFLLSHGTLPRQLDRSLNATLAFERLRRMALSVLRAAIPTPFFTALLRRQLAAGANTFGSSGTVNTAGGIAISVTPVMNTRTSATALNQPRPATGAIRPSNASLSLPALLPLLLGTTFAATAAAAAAAAAPANEAKNAEQDPAQLMNAPFPFVFFKYRGDVGAHALAKDNKMDIAVKVCDPNTDAKRGQPSLLLGVQSQFFALSGNGGADTWIRYNSLKAITFGAITTSFVRYIRPPVTVKDSLCFSLITDETTWNFEAESENDLKLWWAQTWFQLTRSGIYIDLNGIKRLIGDSYPDEVTSCFCSVSRVPSTHVGIKLHYKDDAAFRWVTQFTERPPRELLPAADTSVADQLSTIQLPAPLARPVPALRATVNVERCNPDKWYSIAIPAAVVQFKDAAPAPALGAAGAPDVAPPANITCGDNKEIDMHYYNSNTHANRAVAAYAIASVAAGQPLPDHFDSRFNAPHFTCLFELTQFGPSTPAPNSITLFQAVTSDGYSSIVLNVTQTMREGQVALNVRHNQFATEVACIADASNLSYQNSALPVMIVVDENKPSHFPGGKGAAPPSGGKIIHVYIKRHVVCSVPVPYDFPDLSQLSMVICPRGYAGGYVKHVALYRYAFAPLVATNIRGSIEYLDQIEVSSAEKSSEIIARKGAAALRTIGFTNNQVIATALSDVPSPELLPSFVLQRVLSDFIILRHTKIFGAAAHTPQLSPAHQLRLRNEVLPPGHLVAAEVARQAIDTAAMIGLWTRVMGFDKERCLDAVSVYRQDMSKALAVLIDPTSASAGINASSAIPALAKSALNDPETIKYRRQLNDMINGQASYTLPVATISIPRQNAAQLPDILSRPSQMPDSSILSASGGGAAAAAAAAPVDEKGAVRAMPLSSGKIPLYQIMLQPLARFGFPLSVSPDPARQLSLILDAERGASATMARECIMAILAGSRSTSSVDTARAAAPAMRLSVMIPSGGNSRNSQMLSPVGGNASPSDLKRNATSGGGSPRPNLLTIESGDEKGSSATTPRKSIGGGAPEPESKHAPASLSQLLSMLQTVNPSSGASPASNGAPEVKGKESRNGLSSAFTFGAGSGGGAGATPSAASSGSSGVNFLSRFLRVVFATHSRTDLSQMEESFRSALISEGLHYASNGGASNPHLPVRKVGPELAAELVLQLSVDILKAKSFHSTELPSTEIIFWLVELFLSVIQSAVVTKSGVHSPVYTSLVALLFSPSIVDLLLARVLISLDESVFPLMVLLGRVISVRGVKFTHRQVDQFHAALSRVQNGASAQQLQSPLLRTLMEFSFSLLKASGADISAQQQNQTTSKIFQFEALVHWMRDCKTQIAPTLSAALRATAKYGTSTATFDEAMAAFSPAADSQLVAAVNRVVASKGVSFGSATFNTYLQTESHHYKFLSDKKWSDVELRLGVLRYFNDTYRAILPSVNLSLAAHQSFLSAAVFHARDMVFWSTKEPIWTEAMSKTSVHIARECADFNIKLSLFAANELVENKKTDFRFERSMFGQLHREVSSKEATIYRLEPLKRAWKIDLIGLNAIDVGGPYRDVLEKIVTELQSPVLPLFVLSPNGRVNSGDNRDKYVPRPLPPQSQSNDYHLRIAMYEFLGQFLGLAIRTQNYLPLNFPSIVWKGLVSDEITTDDVRAIDLLSFTILDDINNRLQQSNQTPEMFNAVMSDIKFCVYGSDAKSYELVPGGSRMSVTWANRKQFTDALIAYRLNEFRVQCEAMRRGLATVIPYKNLPLLGWQELEFLVCGSKKVDVELLQSMTSYHDCDASDAHVKLFWQMMRDKFDDGQRAKFLSFVWGRSTMPTKLDPNVKFKIQAFSRAGHGDINRALPITHTCFFALELPKFTNVDAMTERMTYAMVNCNAIDGDSSRQHDLIQTDVSNDADPAHTSLWS